MFNIIINGKEEEAEEAKRRRGIKCILCCGRDLNE